MRARSESKLSGRWAFSASSAVASSSTERAPNTASRQGSSLLGAASERAASSWWMASSVRSLIGLRGLEPASLLVAEPVVAHCAFQCYLPVAVLLSLFIQLGTQLMDGDPQCGDLGFEGEYSLHPGEVEPC